MIMAQPPVLESCLLNGLKDALQNGLDLGFGSAVVFAFQQLSTEMARFY